MYAPLEQIDQAEYASKITDKLFTFYENYFEIKYALPKSGKTSNNQTNRTRVKDKKTKSMSLHDSNPTYPPVNLSNNFR